MAARNPTLPIIVVRTRPTTGAALTRDAVAIDGPFALVPIARAVNDGFGK